jgi:acetyl/propionyl-CoA carboxylase alpha subunit
VADRPVVTSLGNGVYRVDRGDRQLQAWAAGTGTSSWVYFDGRVYVLAPSESSTTHHEVDDEMALTSPMPATVASVNVTPGQSVATGDMLIMLEAMKMELPIVAPRSGRVRSVACRPGELVQPGIRLVELEPADPEPGTANSEREPGTGNPEP